MTLNSAYERLLLDAISGDASLFTRSDEIELAWAPMDPILSGGQQECPLFFYDPKSEGPVEADEFVKKDGRSWHLGCVEHLSKTDIASIEDTGGEENRGIHKSA